MIYLEMPQERRRIAISESGNWEEEEEGLEGGLLGGRIRLGMVLGRFGDCFCSDFPNGYKQVTNLTRPNNNIQKPRWYDMGWPSAVTRN